MLKLRKAIRLETLRRPLKKALAAAAQLGAEAVEINARTELRPHELSQTGLRHFRKLLADFGLSVSCVSFPTRRGYGVQQDLEQRIEATNAALMMASDLKCNVVSNHIGRIPPAEAPENQTLREAIEAIGRYGQRIGATLTARTGNESGQTLADFLERLSPGALGVDFDPAELLIQNHDIESSMSALGRYVLHFRARDAVHDLAGGQRLEVQLGRGSVDLAPLLAILEENNYQGFVTLDRQSEVDVIPQYTQSLEYLDQLFA